MLCLIDLGADVNAQTKSGQTILDLIRSPDIRARIKKIVAEKSAENASESVDSTTDVTDSNLGEELCVNADEKSVNQSSENKRRHSDTVEVEVEVDADAPPEEDGKNCKRQKIL